MLADTNIVIIHNIISPYKTFLFNELHEICHNLKVLYMAETEVSREWTVNRDKLNFPYEVMFSGRVDEVRILRVIIKTWKRLTILNPDVLIIGGYSYPAYWAGFFWAKLFRKKIILWSSSNKEDRRRFFLKEKLKGFFIRRCDAANVYGKKSKDYLVKFGMKKNTVLIMGNTTDNSFYHNETIKLKEKRDELCNQFGIPPHNFLYIGRFSQEKNVLYLLAAFNELAPEHSDWGLILVGNGPQKNKIVDYIKINDIKNVYMPGFKQKQEIPQYLAASDVLILPSISEPWGLVVNEAMASGLPVLVSKQCGCYPDIVKEEVNGFSFDPFNNKELFFIMKNITDKKHDLEKMGENSLEIIKDYTPKRAANIILDTINFVLKKQESTI